jgi:hypothetical protein
MADRDWGHIASGPTFEALATTLVFFEDPRAALFGRRGKDGGQDARSGDGTRVFQAKHHADASAPSAIRDAKAEAAKIAKYRAQGHPRHRQWQGVAHWRLVTNAAFNPTDRQAWDDEVVPLFAAQGLGADYWERRNIEALLDRHPEVDRSFFRNENRVLLTLPEVRARLPEQEPFLRRPELGAFVGREHELGQLQALLVHWSIPGLARGYMTPSYDSKSLKACVKPGQAFSLTHGPTDEQGPIGSPLERVETSALAAGGCQRG